MHATVSLFVALTGVIVSQATPYYYPQQRQLFYPVAPQYPQYYPRQVYYAPPTAANLVSPVQYPVVAPPTKSVVYYGAPAVAPYPGNFLVADGASEGSGGWFQGFEGWNSIASIFGLGNSPTAEKPAEEGSSGAENAEQPAAGAEGSKGGEGSEDKESEVEKPEQPQKVKAAPKGGLQKYVLVGQPQFYGNFNPQSLNPAAVLPSANQGAVSSYLLLRNYPGYRFAPQFPVLPQVPQVSHGAQQPQAPQAADAADAELIPAGQPGAAALGYQKLLKEAAAEAARQSKEYDDAAVSVDAAAPQDDKPEASTEGAEGDKNEEEETGTSSE